MTQVTKMNQTVSTTSISRGRDWAITSNLGVDGEVARCDNITTKIGANNKPYPLVLSKYGFNLPTSAVITGLHIYWRDRTVSYSSDVNESTYPRFDKTTIKFNNCSIKDVSGEAPSKNFTEHHVAITNPTVTATELDSDSFGVELHYSYNNSDNTGGVYLDYVRITVEYEIPAYNVSITDPRSHNHDPSFVERYAPWGDIITWSTEDYPVILSIGEECETAVYFRSINGYDGGIQTVRINFPINYKLLDITPSTGELIVYEDKTYVDWVVAPPLNNIGGWCKTVNCKIKFSPRAYNETDMVSATILSTGQVHKCYIYVSTDINYSDDVNVVVPQFRQLEDAQQFVLITNVERVPVDAIKDNNDVYPVQVKLWSMDSQEYVPFLINKYNDIQSSNGNITPNISSNEDNTTYYIDLTYNNYDTYENRVITALYTSLSDFDGEVGEYEFHVFIPHDYELSNYDKYTFSAYMLPAIHYEFTPIAEKWLVHTCNIATSDGIGYAFNCRTANGFQYKTRMHGSKCILEHRVRHIGGLRLTKSHYEPKLKFSNKVNKGVYKNRAYFNKTGQWEHDLSLNIYLPKYDWKTLQEFVKMDKPVAIDTCPSCSDDDVLNHRGFVEVEDISNVERVNSWWYKGEIGVQRITDKYYGKANIIKGNRVSSANIPYTFYNVIQNGDYYLNYFELQGGGQLLYDTDNNIINQIIVPTGEDLHLRSKWVSKDIDDYKFNWRQVLPSEPTDESNDYKYNSIVYSIIDNLTGDVILTYTLYDFTTFNEVGTVINTCKASCTVFDINRTPTLLFTKQIRLDYDEITPTDYRSTTRFQFNGSTLTISESGLNGIELIERNINLPSGEYLMDIAFCNNDVGLLEPDFVAYLNMDLQENIIANPLSNFYSDLLVSSFILPNLNLLFYRYSDDGLIYYYYGNTEASYIVDGYAQYKGGVDLQTSSGASILFIDNYTQVLYLNNGLCKIGFDRTFGTVSFYVYDAKTDKFLYVNMVKIDNWADFDIMSITDDKAVVQFGETIWTMWRGHPFVQCEHINTDLKINDDYNTINSEAIVTTDGDIVYDGSYGKNVNYLYSVITSPLLSIGGTHAPNFISGDTVTLTCYVQDKYGNKLNEEDYDDATDIGKVLFSIKGFDGLIDPTPSADANGDYYWTKTFTPPFKNEDYEVTATLLPVGKFTESTSSKQYFTVRKIDTIISDSGDDTVGLSDETYSIEYTLATTGGTALQSKPLKIYCNDEYVTTIYTNSNGKATYTHTLSVEEILQFYAVFEGDNTYNPFKTPIKNVIVIDDTKTDVTLTSNITIGNNGSVTLAFTGVGTGNVSVTVNGETYTFAMTSSKTIHVEKTGTYNYRAVYQGTEVYNMAYLESSFTVAKTTPTIGLSSAGDSTINLGTPITFTITGSISNMPYTLYDNDSPVASGTLSSGTKTIEYSPSYAGTHSFKAVYKGDTWTNSVTSSTISVTVENSNTTLVHKNGDIYRNSKDYILLKDGSNSPIPNKQIKYTVNGVTYSRTTNGNGIASMDINLQEGTYPVHIAFLGDSAYNQSSLDYNLTVKGFETVWKAPNGVQSSHDSRTAPYQIWQDTSFDGVNGSNYASCGNSTSVYSCIGTRAGTWNTPDELKLWNYGFNLPSGAIIKEIKARVYERQFDPRSNAYPNIGNAVITIGGLDPRTANTQPLKARTGFNVNEVTWSNPSKGVSELNNSNFTVFLNHGKNNSGDTGCIMLKYFEVGVSYTLPTTME